MANEIQITGYAQLVNGYNKIKRELPAISGTQAGTDFNGPVKYTLTAAYASAGKGNITSLGWCIIENLDAAGGEAVVVSLDGGSTDHLSIDIGEWMMLKLVAAFTITNLQVKAETSAGTCAITLFEA